MKWFEVKAMKRSHKWNVRTVDNVRTCMACGDNDEADVRYCVGKKDYHPERPLFEGTVPRS